MAVRIAVGEESFDEFRKSGFYYVDKTELLYDLIGQTTTRSRCLLVPAGLERRSI